MGLTCRVNAIAVIGANYGDEGKGAVVNALSRRHKPEYVIRFNGGGQAGHTVQLKDGTRHVFSTFGSGTFYGAKTYYTQDVLVSPGRLQEEYLALRGLGIACPILHVNQGARVVTRLDTAANQFGEAFRRDAGHPHGTCGMGIGECVHRHLHGGPETPFWSRNDDRSLKDWFDIRIKELAHETSADLSKYSQAIASAREVKEDMSTYGFASCVTEPFFASIEPTVIFEGAQGLLLDEDDPDHQPYVTWSKTGLTNVIKECQKHGWHLSEVHYVTRPYLTRHGVGPMHAADPHATIPWEDGKQPVDLTNVDNKWQGDLRYAAMDWDKFGARVNKDFRLAIDAWPEDPPRLNIHFTCFDQMVHMWTPPPLTAPDVTGGWLVSTNGLEG